MTRPYHFRICCALPGGPVIELFRASRHYAQADRNYWTLGLSREWNVWVEHTLSDYKCITIRPTIRPPHVAVNAEKARFYPVNPHQEAI